MAFRPGLCMRWIPPQANVMARRARQLWLSNRPWALFDGPLRPCGLPEPHTVGSASARPAGAGAHRRTHGSAPLVAGCGAWCVGSAPVKSMSGPAGRADPRQQKNTGHGRRCSPRGAIHPCAGIIPIRSTVGGGEATLSARLPELPLRRVSIVGSRLLGASGAVKTRGGSAVPTLARMVWVGHGPIPLPGAASVPAGVTRSVTTRAETRSLGISC
jgi:hypothetical protein